MKNLNLKYTFRLISITYSQF